MFGLSMCIKKKHIFNVGFDYWEFYYSRMND